MKFTLSILAFLLAAAPASAFEYPCPSDPGFCYFDVGNDGCFDAGTDTGPIDTDLEAGTFPPVGPPLPGSIICPPDAGNLNLAVPTTWETAPGGGVRLYGPRLVGVGGPVSIVSGAGILIGGRVSNVNAITLHATDDIEIEQSLLLTKSNSGVDVESTSAGIVIGPKVKIKAGGSTFTAAGNIEIGSRAKLQIFAFNHLEWDFITPGALASEDLDIKGGSELRLQVGSLEVGGKFKLNPSRFYLTATGAVRIGRMLQKDGEVHVTASSIEIGIPDAKGKVRSSKLKTTEDVQMSATGDIRMDGVKIIAPTSFSGPDAIDLDAGGDLSFVDGTIRSRPSQPRDVMLTAGGGFSCDLTGTKLQATVLTLNCDTVVGP